MTAADPRAHDIRVTGVRKRFGSSREEALAGIDLEVRNGELLALLGPSGSGKTTLLRVIAGLETPDEGRVFFGAEDVTDRPVQERGIGFVFQHYALFRHLTVFENVAYGLRARRPRPAASMIRERVGALLALVQLDGFGPRFPAQLSGGQRQRVALARALAPEPRALLMDEPFGALDAQVRKDLRRWLRHIHRQTGQTTLFVTHDQDEALELADRVAILNGGRLEQVGAPDEIYDRSASPFVMQFVGDSARLPVRIERGVAQFGGRALPVAAEHCPDGEGDLFVRPTDLWLSPDGGGELAGELLAVRRVRGQRRASIRLDEGGIELEADDPGGSLREGDQVRLTLLGGRVFPRSTPR